MSSPRYGQSGSVLVDQALLLACLAVALIVALERHKDAIEITFLRAGGTTACTMVQNVNGSGPADGFGNNNDDTSQDTPPEPANVRY